MKFEDTYFSKEEGYSIGQELESGKYYLSIPVRNTLVEYNEYYEITEAEYNAFPNNTDRIQEIIQLSRERKNDARLIIQPGAERGFA
jgi:hypothetical protein